MERVIPVGYIVKMSTCENDGDNYKTNIFTGLTKEQMDFLKTVAIKFKSGYADSVFGNKDKPTAYYSYEEDDDEFLLWFRDTFESIPKIVDWNFELDITIAQHCYDIIEHVVGSWYDDDMFRYVSNCVVWHNPSIVEFDLVED